MLTDVDTDHQQVKQQYLAYLRQMRWVLCAASANTQQLCPRVLGSSHGLQAATLTEALAQKLGMLVPGNWFIACLVCRPSCRACLAETDISQLEGKWRQLDVLWMDIRHPVQVHTRLRACAALDLPAPGGPWSSTLF